MVHTYTVYIHTYEDISVSVSADIAADIHCFKCTFSTYLQCHHLKLNSTAFSTDKSSDSSTAFISYSFTESSSALSDTSTDTSAH